MVLELPAVAFADRVAGALVPVAGAFLALLLARHGHGVVALLPAVTSLGFWAWQVRNWTRSRMRPALVLERLPTGRLVVHVAGQGTVPATLGGRTRLLGPSVFLDVAFAPGGRRQVFQGWLTRFDVPAGSLRRWSVVLPSCGREACS